MFTEIYTICIYNCKFTKFDTKLNVQIPVEFRSKVFTGTGTKVLFRYRNRNSGRSMIYTYIICNMGHGFRRTHTQEKSCGYDFPGVLVFSRFGLGFMVQDLWRTRNQSTIAPGYQFCSILEMYTIIFRQNKTGNFMGLKRKNTVEILS